MPSSQVGATQASYGTLGTLPSPGKKLPRGLLPFSEAAAEVIRARLGRRPGFSACAAIGLSLGAPDRAVADRVQGHSLLRLARFDPITSEPSVRRQMI